jgi:hypothetical protein
MEEFLQDFSVELSEVENRRLAAYSAGVRNMQMQMGTHPDSPGRSGLRTARRDHDQNSGKRKCIVM